MAKNKTLHLLYSYLLIACFSGGCAGTDKVGVDLVEYVNQDILGIAQLEAAALSHYSAVIGQNYRNDQVLLTALNEQVIPIYKRFLNLLRKIQPRRDEIRQLHGIYIGGAEDLYNGFNIMRSALERKDKTQFQAANRKIENGRMKTEKWRRELFTLYQTHGVRAAAENRESKIPRLLIDPSGH